MSPNLSAQPDTDPLRTAARALDTRVTELCVPNMSRALDTYLGLGYDAISVADGYAFLRSEHEDRTVVLRSIQTNRTGRTHPQ